MPIDQKLKDAQDAIIAANHQAREKEKAEKLGYTSNMRSLNKQQRQSEKDANANQKWKKIIENLQNLKADWSRGYNNDWISCVYTIMALSEELGKAIALLDPVGQTVEKIVDQLDKLTGKGLKGLLGLAGLIDPNISADNATFSTMVREGVDSYLYKYPPAMLFPSLVKHAAFTNDALNLDSLREMKSTNGTPIFKLKQNPEGGFLLDENGLPMLDDAYVPIHDNLKAALKTIVVAWLDERGYTAIPNNPNKFQKANNEVLDKATFDTLRDDPQEGLSNYLVGKLDQQLNPAPAPAPRP